MKDFLSIVRQLPIVRIDKMEYFLDERLKEYRQIDNPHNRISFDEIGDRKPVLVEKNLLEKKRERKLKRGKGQ